ncbi:MAG: tetratricopeptide repeat protein, partial [Bacteroidales bacterium]
QKDEERAFAIGRRHEKSIEYYKKYLEEEPMCDNGWYNLGVVYCIKEDYEKAIQAFDYAIALNPENVSAYFNKANTYANNGKYELAIKAYNDFLMYEQENIYALFYIAECYEKLGNDTTAKKYFTNVLNIDPLFSEAWYALSLLELKNNNIEKAIETVEKAIRINKGNPDYWFTLGNLLKINKKESSLILSCYDRAIELYPYNETMWIEYAEELSKYNGVNQAIQTLENAIDYLENDPEILYTLAAYYYKNNQREKALEKFKIASMEDKKQASTFFNNCLPNSEDFKLFAGLI